MPRIREIQSQVGVSGPVGGRAATAQDFGGGIGQAVEGFGQVVEGASDAIQKRVQQSEYSDYYAQHSQKQAEWVDKFRTEMKKAKPGDNEFASRLMTEYQEDMAKLSEGITQLDVKEYAKRSSAEATSQFYKLAQSGQAELAAIQVSQNFEKAIQSDSMLLTTDPTQIDAKITGLNSYVETLDIDAEKKEVLRQQGKERLVGSAIKGYIEIDPAQAMKDIQSGKLDSYFKDGVQKDKFIGEAREEERRRFYEDERVRRAKEEQDDKLREEAKTKLIDDHYTGKGVSTKDVKNSPLKAEEKRSMYQLLASKKHDVTDNKTYTGFLKRIHGLDENNPSEPTDNELVQAVVNQKIDLQALQFLRNERLGKNTVEGKSLAASKKAVYKSAEKAFQGTGYIKNANWADDMSEFNRAMQTKEAEYRRKGTPLTELYDPQGEDFLKTMNQFRKSDKDILKQRASQVGGNLDKKALVKQASIEDRVPQDESGKKDQFGYALKQRLMELDPEGNRQRTYPGYKERIEKEMRENWEVYQDWKKNPRRYNAWTAGKVKSLFEDVLPAAVVDNTPDPAVPESQRQPGESLDQWKKRTGRS